MLSADYNPVAIQPPSDTWDADSTLVYARLAALYRLTVKSDAEHFAAAQAVSHE
jgi:hypothetical protein